VTLGAGRLQIIRQLLTESMLLPVFGSGSIMGITIAFFGIRWLLALAPEDISRMDSVSLIEAQQHYRYKHFAPPGLRNNHNHKIR
jgi:hypothetical protein